MMVSGFGVVLGLIGVFWGWFGVFPRTDPKRQGTDTGSGTPRPKTISARDSSAQIDFFTGTLRPGTTRPRYKKYFIQGRNCMYAKTHVRTTWWQTSIVESLFYRRETLYNCLLPGALPLDPFHLSFLNLHSHGIQWKTNVYRVCFFIPI